MSTPLQQSSKSNSKSIEDPACQPTRQSGSKKCGFACEFIEKPPKAVQAECPVCLQILCEPYQVTCCGYSFCKTCIEQIESDKKSCPTCNGDLSQGLFPNKGLQRSLYEFRVYCTHKQQGCEWTGELGQLDKHLNLNPQPDEQLQGCQYSEIECQFCHNLIQRHTITTHQANLCPKRPFSCEYCLNYQSDYDDVIHNHWLVCGFHPVPCPNECGTFPQRQNLQTHITNECPLTVIDCDFHHVGCDVKLPRKDMPTHLKENLVTHMSLQAASHSKLLASHTQLQENCRKLEENCRELKDSKEIAHRLIIDNETLKIQLLENQVREQCKVELLQTEVIKLRREIQVLSSSPSTHAHELVPYIEGMATPGYFTFTMTGFEEKRKLNDWRSPAFYTHFHGYKMFLKIHPNGDSDGKDTHVSVYAILLKGRYDSDLKWPFQGYITVQLVDQEKDEEHHSMTIPYDDETPWDTASRVTSTDKCNRTWGYSKFIPHDKLEPNYLKNNCLCFRITKVQLKS